MANHVYNKIRILQVSLSVKVDSFVSLSCFLLQIGLLQTLIRRRKTMQPAARGKSPESFVWLIRVHRPQRVSTEPGARKLIPSTPGIWDTMMMTDVAV